MSAFIASAGLMLALAMSFVLPPLLLRQTATDSGWRQTPCRRWPIVVLVLALPLLVTSLYLLLGNPKGLQPGPEVLATQAGADINPEQMVARLAGRLKQQPGDADGWRMLARSYETLGRFDAAADAYRQLVALEPNNPDLLVDYAVVLGMTLDHHLSGAPQALIEKALALDPNNVQALALEGSAALERGDVANAVKPWKKILALVPIDSDIGHSIANSIAKAEQQAGSR